MPTFETINTDFGSSIQRNNDDGSVTFIPVDNANPEYQAYLATLPSNSSTPQAGE